MTDVNKTSTLGIFTRDAIPEGAKPIENFQVRKYLGKWYDIARMTFEHEGPESSNVYLIYYSREDGLVGVNNNAYLDDRGEWYSRVGKAKFRGEANLGALAVYFDDLQWSGYNVMAIDGDYEYALVFGRNTDLMWMLSRTKTMPDDIKQKYLKMAEEIGYDTSKLVFTKHDREDV